MMVQIQVDKSVTIDTEATKRCEVVVGESH